MSQTQSSGETIRIRRQLEQAFDGGAWHGPSLQEIFTNIPARLASVKPTPDLHSIWEITLHLIATQRVLLRRLDGDATAINLPESQEWPAVGEQSELAWQEAIDQLAACDHAIRDRIESFPNDRLDEPLIPGGSSAYNNFHGYVQHNLYHAAQINLLKKMLAS